MDNENLNKAFDSNSSGDKRNLRVHLINPPIANPWRTRKEYIEERSKLLELQEKQIDALISIKKASWQQTIAFIITIVLALATLIGTWISVSEHLEKSSQIYNNYNIHNKALERNSLP
jgi:hypothetical protein